MKSIALVVLFGPIVHQTCAHFDTKSHENLQKPKLSYK